MKIELMTWLFSEAGAGWIFGVVTLILLLWSRKSDFRPAKIVVKELWRVRPILVKPDIKSKISIKFNGSDIEALGQIEVSIFNTGRTTISNPKLTIEVQDHLKILDVALTGPANGNVTIDMNRATVFLNFLNPKKDHNHAETLSLITNGKIDSIKVNGSGEGWSVRHIGLPSSNEAKMTLKIFLGGMAALVVSVLTYGYWLDTAHGIPLSEVSLRAFIWYIPILVPTMAWIIFGYVRLNRVIRA